VGMMSSTPVVCRHCGAPIEECDAVNQGWIHAATQEEHCVDADGSWQDAQPAEMPSEQGASWWARVRAAWRGTGPSDT
jgi:hypothetical protein